MQFMSQKLKEFVKICGIQLKHTTSYLILECYYGKDSVRTFTTASTCHRSCKLILVYRFFCVVILTKT
ncbi:hypothetical protein LAZ67_4002784 [Cordylochernes scorpioides]|uniref:Uncharacterized protein n=1 Tax=Cordylochernes scorpioides TaxID=51811 RepID=A0ABY6KD83_9ARAC|nr:hypothetical protein LAZ67_4002784 [Cordylochernes scorpioides]